MPGFLARPRHEIVAVVLFFGAFLGINFATVDRTPVVYQDEVMFADPAVNLYLGHGFTSTAWYQPRSHFFAGNAPLYSMILYPWLEGFGFHETSVRSLNFVLVLTVVVVCWVGLARFDLVRTPGGRLVFGTLVLCGDGVAFSYRGGRYDCIGMLIVAAMFVTLSLERASIRRGSLLLLAALIPWAGLQLIPYLALMGLIVLILRGRAAGADLVVVAIGELLGAATLAGLFAAEGVWSDFLKSVALHGGARRTLAERFANALAAHRSDLSTPFLLAALCVLLASVAWQRRLTLRSPGVVGLTVGLLVPCALAFTGKYMRYYAWMAVFPLAAGLAVHLERHDVNRFVRGCVFGLSCLAACVGLPARLAVACFEWNLRDPAPVCDLVARYVHADDWVFSEYEAYYPAKQSAAVLFLPPYIGETSGLGPIDEPMTHTERDRVNVLITKPDSEARTLRFFGGGWDCVGHYFADPSLRIPILARIGFGAKPYGLIVYRRAIRGAPSVSFRRP